MLRKSVDIRGFTVEERYGSILAKTTKTLKKPRKVKNGNLTISMPQITVN